MNAPLRLFWWKGVPNFGDALSPAVVAHLSGRPVVHAGMAKAEMLAIGSLLKVARRKLVARPRADGPRPVIWGTGLLTPVPRDLLEHVDIALLRGPVTAALLDVKTDVFGDPGLLAPEMFAAPERRDVIGIVPHHSLADAPALHALVASDPAFELIDPRGEVGAVCRRIASCAHVFASSLHGLIVADAYGVGSTWLDPVGQSRLKYVDYAASVGRDLTGPIAVGDIRAALRGLTGGALAHQSGIARARAALRQTFPAAVAAGTEHAATSAA